MALVSECESDVIRKQLVKEVFLPILVLASGGQQSSGGGSSGGGSSYEDQVPAASGDNGLIGFYF